MVSHFHLGVHDRQIMKGPAQMIVLLEANAAVADLLRRPPVQGALQAPPGLERRQTFQYFVERGPEDGKSILIAARKDTCSRLEVLKYDCHDDHRSGEYYCHRNNNHIAIYFCRKKHNEHIKKHHERNPAWLLLKRSSTPLGSLSD